MKILKYPNPILQKKCKDITIGDQSAVNILNEMADLMYVSNGVGLAAPQVGFSLRMIVIDVRNPECLYKMINPKITYKSDDCIDFEEGCLSLPNIYDIVTRHEKVKVEYYDCDFKKCTLSAGGVLSICLQHEIDHLDGKLYVDRLNFLKRRRIIKRYLNASTNESKL